MRSDFSFDGSLESSCNSDENKFVEESTPISTQRLIRTKSSAFVPLNSPEKVIGKSYELERLDLKLSSFNFEEKNNFKERMSPQKEL